MEELRKAVEAAEQNRQAAMRALAEERQRSLELQVKISRQVPENSMFSLCARSCKIKFGCGYKPVYPSEIHVIVTYSES